MEPSHSDERWETEADITNVEHNEPTSLLEGWEAELEEKTQATADTVESRDLDHATGALFTGPGSSGTLIQSVPDPDRPSLSELGLSENEIRKIISEVEWYQARHALVAVACIIGGVLLVLLTYFARHPADGAPPLLGTFIASILYLGSAIPFGAALLALPKSISDAKYWKERPEQLAKWNLYESWSVGNATTNDSE